MTLLNPLALLYVLPAIAVLWLARRRAVRTRRAVATLFLWRALGSRESDVTARLRLRRNLLLLVQAAVMLTLVFALSRPTLTIGRSHVDFLIDLSASMGARDGVGTRLDLARQAALVVARSLPRGTNIGVWTTDRATSTVDEVRADRLDDVLQRLHVTAGGADINRSLTAIEVVHGTRSPIFVFTDTPTPDVREAHVQWTSVGHSADNVAITALAGRHVRNPQPMTEILVGIRNFGSTPVEAPFVLRRGEAVLITDRLRIPAHGVMTTTLQLPSLTGVVSAQLLTDDALNVDNVRSTVLPPITRQRVLLVTSGSFFLEHALAANPSVVLDVVPPGQTWPRTGYDVVVCDACNGVPEGVPALLVPAAPAAASAPQAMRVTREGHPLATFLDLSGIGGVAVPGAVLRAGDEVIARAGDAPAVVASESGRRRLVELRLQLRDSPLVLNVAFPILVSNAIAWLTTDRGNATAIIAGNPLQWTVTPGADVIVRGPDGAVLPATVNSGRLSIASLSRAGAYDVQVGQSHQAVVVNPATETESDLSVVRAQPPASSAPGTPANEPVPITTPLLVAALVFLGVETALSRPLSSRARAFRAALALSVVAGAAAPRIPWGHADMDVLFLLDHSSSMANTEGQAVSTISEVTKTMRGGDRAGVIVFGANAAVEHPLESGLRVSSISSQVSPNATNIEAALTLARATLDREGVRRVVLISDGNQTAGDAIREATLAAAEHLRVDAVGPPPPHGDGTSLSVESLSAPAIVRTGEPFRVSVAVRGRPGAHGEVDVRRDDEVTTSLPVVVRADGSGLAEFTDVHSTSSMHTYTAAMHIEGAPDGLSEAGTVVTVSGQPSVLYVSNGARTLASVLGNAQWHVSASVPSSLPAGAPELRRYDAVVLEDIPADRLSAAQTAALTEYVERDGGGLLVLGGASSLASFSASSLARMLPVDVRPRTGKRGPGVALVLAFDKSGSMADVVGGISKIELARQSVVGALQALSPTDLFGVIAFDSKPVAIATLAAAPDASGIARRLRALDAGGSTSIAPAIDLAESWLQSSGAGRRRVLLVSDGRTSPADVDRLRAAVRSRRFELSVVAIGDDADRALLTSLASESGGRAYFPSDVSELPKIVARDAASSSSGAQVNEPFTARLLPHAITRGLEQTRPPLFRGYVVSTAKPGADVLMTSHLDDPLLAGWRVGLGHVAVFTSDLQLPWAQSLRTWAGSASLWSQTARWVGRRSSASPARLTLERTDTGIHVLLTFEPSRGDARVVEASASIRPPSGPPFSIALDPAAPGRFESAVAASAEGPYVVSLTARQGNGDELRLTQGAYWAPIAERDSAPSLATLSAIAQVTGGRILQPGESPFTEERPGRPTDTRAIFLNAALLAFMIDLVRRRGVFSSWLTRQSTASPLTQPAAA